MKTSFFVVLSILLATSLCLANEPSSRPVQARVTQQKILDELRVSTPKYRQRVRCIKTTHGKATTSGLNLRVALNKLRKSIQVDPS